MFLRFATCLVAITCLFASNGLGQTLAQSTAGSSAADGGAATTPTPTVDTYAVPAPSAMSDSQTFAYVDNVQCTDVVANASFQIYANNPALFNKCVVEGKYQIFPYGGKLPTQSQVDSMVRSPACRSVFTACVLGNLPQCDIGGLALKSATETLLKIAIDVLAGQKAPDSEKFYELLLWRRDVNLAQARGLPYDQDSQLYGEYSRNLWKALTNTNVKVSEDLTITFEGQAGVNGDVFANVTSGSDASDIIGIVKPGGSSMSGSFVNGENVEVGSAAADFRCLRAAAMTCVLALLSLW